MNPISIARSQLTDLECAIAHQRDQVLDLDICVDDTRHAVDRALDDLREAVRDRDRAAVHLAHLVELHLDIPKDLRGRR